MKLTTRMTRAFLLGASALGGLCLAPMTAQAQEAAQAGSDETTEVVVTGYRRSLENASREKRNNTNFTDSIFAEDIGKFPDINLAESLQRLPGIQIERDVANEGSRVNVRGLGSQFTILTMNGAQIQSVSDTNPGALSEGRGASLDLFPTELFRSLTLSKSPTASQAEGAIAGNVELRPVRPFDRPGFQVNWQIKNTYQDTDKSWSPRAGVFVSNTWDTSVGRIGLLGGVAYVEKTFRSDIFNTVGNTTFNLGTRCPTNQAGCNSLAFNGVAGNTTYGYGGGATIPATVPTGMGFGLTAGNPLTVCGTGGTSGLSCSDLSYTLMPRLARAEVVNADRSRKTALVTAQWKPSDNLTFNLDLTYTKSSAFMSQNDLMLMLRSTNNLVPINFQINEDKVLTKGTFGNVQMLSENRATYTDNDFANYSLGMDYRVSDLIRLRGVLTYNSSHMDQSGFNYLFRTPLGRGYYADYEQSPGMVTPSIKVNFDPNSTNIGWIWDTLRVQPMYRDLIQRDAQFHAEFGDDKFMISTGVQATNFSRAIINWDTSNCATNANNGVCATGSSFTSAYPGAIASVPNAQLGNYMTPWPYGQLFSNSSFDVGLGNGWAIPDYDKLASAINLHYFEQEIDPATRLASVNPRAIREKTNAAYVQVDGNTTVFAKPFKYNAGLRYFETEQKVSGIVTDPATGRGVQHFDNKYSDWLPSVNAALDVRDDVVVRFAAARTLTRPNPNDLAPGFSLSVSGDSLSIGNPELAPYFANQLDLGVEWYLSRNNTLSLNLWQKKVEGFTDIVRRTERFGDLDIVFANLPQATKDGLTAAGNGNPNNAPVTVSQRQNTSEVITLNGLEVTLLQPLDFLVDGLGFTANYTRIEQETNAPPTYIGTRLRKSPVTSLSPNTYNVSVYYEKNDISARVSYNYRDPFLATQGPLNNVEGDIIFDKTAFLDASLSFPLPFYKAVRFSIEGQNLTNEVQVQTVDGNPMLPYQAVSPGRTVMIGFSGKF